ncbi:UDP-glucose 4-epimerase [Minicystis rosea]|nr:UDP-glucose 4-epimerase [Minicystis rosea]
MRIAITGVTSGVGMRLAEIAIAEGHTIAGLVRDPERADARRLQGLGVRLVHGDLDATTALDDLCRDADAVVHTAAHVGDQGTLEQFERVNVGGTRNTIDAAVRASVPRFVHLSSVAVYGRPPHGRVTEDWPTKKIGLPYEDTKAEAERLAFRVGKLSGIEVTAVRPPIIYGPYDRNFLPRAMAALRGHRFLLIDGGRAPLNVVWVDHVVDVLLRAASLPAAAGEIFNVMDEVDTRPPSVREVAETIAREAGLPRPRLSLPMPVARALAVAVERGWEMVGAKGTPPITPFVVTMLTRDVIYDSGKAVRLLGWSPKIRALQGIARFAREAAGRPASPGI